MKKSILQFLLSIPLAFHAQVGIGTPTPNAQLEIKSSSESTPTITDGLLIPKVNNFPATNPTVAQQGMLVYLKNISGTNQPGFYYWDFGTLLWKPIAGVAASGTLDQAYDFGGAGLGKTIRADAGAVLINGTDGLVSTGTPFSGASAPSGPGTRMVWNPRKGAFRAGSVNNIQWDNNNVGQSSTAFGENNLASGIASSAFGQVNQVTGTIAAAFGTGNTASGFNAFAFGSSNGASGFNALAFGAVNFASGENSTASGYFNSSKSFNETVLGIGATDYTPSTNGESQFRAANATDRLFVVGNALDVNNNGLVDNTERSDALIILKNGATGIGIALPEAALDIKSTKNGFLIPRVALTSTAVQAPVTNPQTGNLATSTLIYNTAISGVSPNNVSPGFYYWNGTKWTRFDVNGENNPKYYTALGTQNAATPGTGSGMTLMPEMQVTFIPNESKAMVNFSAAGFTLSGNCGQKALFFQIVLNGVPVKGWQTSIEDIDNVINKPIWESTVNYLISVTPGVPQTVEVFWNLPGCVNEKINQVAAPSTISASVTYEAYRMLTVIDPNGGGGIIGTAPVTPNMWSQIGNLGTDDNLNFLGTKDARSLVLKSNNIEGLRIGINGNVGINTPTPLDKLHVIGNIRMVDGNQAVGKVLTSNNNGTASWQNASANAWGIAGNTGTNTTINYIGTTDNTDIVFKRNNVKSGLISSTNTSFGLSALNPLTTGIDNTANGVFALQNNTTGSENTANGIGSLSGNTTGEENSGYGRSSLSTNTTGSQNSSLGYYSSVALPNLTNATAIGARATVGASNSLVLGSINGLNGATATVNVGIGTSNPLDRLHVSGSIRMVDGNQAAGKIMVSNANGTASWQTNSATNAWGLAGNAGTTTATNFIGTTDNNNFAIRTNNNEKVRILATGEFGIGTNTPDRKLEVSGNGTQYTRLTNTGSGIVGLEFKRAGGGSDWQMRNEGGEIIIGQSNDDLATVADVVRIGGSSFTPVTDNFVQLGQIARRWTSVHAINGVIQTSDANDKKQMLPLTYGLDKIKNLRPISFQWKDNQIDNFSTHLGFVAQEVQQTLPEVVVNYDWEELPEGQGKVWKKTERLGMKYAEIIPVLVKAVQEQQTIIETQKTQLDAQSKTITEVLERLKTIENKN